MPYTTTNQELNDMFAKFGKVLSATLITDKYTGRSRGFGFVEMENDEECEKAIKELNGLQMNGRAIAVSVARPREERPARDNFAPRGGGDHRGYDRNR